MACEVAQARGLSQDLSFILRCHSEEFRLRSNLPLHLTLIPHRSTEQNYILTVHVQLLDMW